MKRYSSYLIPSLIASVFLSAYVIVDGFFIGNKMSDIGLSAINIGWPVVAILQSLGIGLGISAGIYISMQNGLENYDKAKRAKSAAIFIFLIVGVVFSLLIYFTRKPLIYLFGGNDESYPYADEYLKYELIGGVFWVLGPAMIPLLKNSGKSSLALCASLIGIFTNLVLDYVFIYLLNMGLKGAAIASITGEGVMMVIALIFYFKELGGLVFDKSFIKALFKGMFAPFILNYSYDIILIITNRVVGYYNGNEAIAAYAMLTYILYVVNAIAQGVGDGIQPMFSFYQAKNDSKMLKHLLFKSVLISFVINTLLAISFFIFKKEFAQFFNLSNVSTEIFINGALYYGIGFILISITKVIASYFYSVDKKISANIITISEPFILTPLCYLLCIPFGFNAVWWSYAIIQGLLFIITVSLYIKDLRSRNGRIFTSRQAERDNISNSL